MSTEPGDTYLYRFTNNHSNVSIQPGVLYCVLGGYFNLFNSIHIHNMMRKSYLVQEKY